MSGSHIVAQPVVRRVLVAVLAIASVVLADMSLSVSASARSATVAEEPSRVGSATRSVLCDRYSSRVIERRHFEATCPSGWRSADGGPVLCSRAKDGKGRAFNKRCPNGWINVVLVPAMECSISRYGRSYRCGIGLLPTTTVASTTTTTVAPTTTTTQPAASFDARGWEAEILRLTNLERQANGLGKLAACPRLATAALAHTNRMLAGQFYAHKDPDTGTYAKDRIRATGYGYPEGGFRWRVGENIAMGFMTAEATMTGWMNSPGHRKNILNPEFTHLGVGVSIGVWDAWRGTYSNWNSVTMATQNFGTGGRC